MVATTHKANKERIRTWRGRVVISDTRSGPEETGMRMKSEVYFSYSQADRATRYNRKCVDWTEIVKGSEKQRFDEYFVNGLRKGEDFYRLGPITPKSHKGNYGAGLYPLGEEKVGPAGDDFDPMYWFTDHGESLDQRFHLLFEGATQGKDLGKGSIKRDGDTIVLQFTAGLLNRYVVNLSQGGNMLKYEGKVGASEETWTYQYEKFGEVWVPKKITYHTRNENEEYTRNLEWVENVVNEPLRQDQFSLPTLGLRRGDVIRDARTGTRLTVQGNEYPPAPDAEASPAQHSTSRAWMVITSLILIVVLVAILVGADTGREKRHRRRCCDEKAICLCYRGNWSDAQRRGLSFART